MLTEIKELVAEYQESRGFPKGREDLRLAVTALDASAANIDHAARIIDKCIVEHGYFPSAREMRECAPQVAVKSQAAIRREHCPQCEGTGFILGLYLVTPQAGHNPRWQLVTDEQAAALRAKGIGYEVGKQSLVEARRPCSCRSGR